MFQIDIETGSISPIDLWGEQSAEEKPEPIDLSVTSRGELLLTFITESKVYSYQPAGGILSELAGCGTAGFSGDGGLACRASLNFPVAAVSDALGDVFIADANNFVVRKVDRATGMISTIAGVPGQRGYTGDGGPAIEAHFDELGRMCVDATGNLIIADLGNSAIRRVDRTTGIVTTLVGSGAVGSHGSHHNMAQIALRHPASVACDEAGNLYIGDTGNAVIRRLNMVGTPADPTKAGAEHASLQLPQEADWVASFYAAEAGDLAVSESGDLFVLDSRDNRILMVDQSGRVRSAILPREGQPARTFVSLALGPSGRDLFVAELAPAPPRP